MRRMYRQKGIAMNKPKKYTAFKMGWGCIGHHLGGLISEILGREVSCKTKREDFDYWCAFTDDGKFTISEIATLIEAVDGGKEMYTQSIPTDSNTSKSLAMDLCQALLKKALDSDWVEEMVKEDALWIIGDFPEDRNIMTGPIDWIIHLVGNGMECAECGKVENPFIEHACNAHTHGMEKYGHPDFQMVLHTNPKDISYILNTLGMRVKNGERFKPGDMVSGIFLDCDVRLDAFEECGRTVLRVIIPDGQNRFPEDEGCTYPYSIQTLTLEQLEANGGTCS